jgi:D-threonate/D-erythronate kinase
MRRPTVLRLLADDMTGALDSAAAFVAVFGALDVVTGAVAGGSLVIDGGTREAEPAVAAACAAALGRALAPAPDRLSFFKVDSLLRGSAGAELCAVLRVTSFDHVVVAPALPGQGRITRGGRQLAADGAVWRVVGEDLAATLASAGLPVQTGSAGAPMRRGVSVWDAETDDDLDAVAARGLAVEGSLLWVGSMGLASAVARRLSPTTLTAPALEGPVLGLVGTDHPVMLAQLDRVARHVVSGSECDRDLVRRVEDGLRDHGFVMVRCELPAGAERMAARMQIAAMFSDVACAVSRPGVLFVSGGETLRGLLAPLGAQGLTLIGEHAPGAPVSRFIGGRWDGLAVVSKSGAFGKPDFLESMKASASGRRRVQSA